MEYRRVEPGPIIDGLRVIREGLGSEEWLVVNGVQRVRAGAQVDPQPQAIFLEPGRPYLEAHATKL